MKLFEATPFMIQEGISERERFEKARALAKRDKCVNDIMDGVYSGKATDQSNNYDRKELQSFMELK